MYVNLTYRERRVIKSVIKELYNHTDRQFPHFEALKKIVKKIKNLENIEKLTRRPKIKREKYEQLDLFNPPKMTDADSHLYNHLSKKLFKP